MTQLLERLGLGRKDLRAWAMYDWANSAFQTTIIAAVFPIYFHNVVAADLGEARGRGSRHRSLQQADMGEHATHAILGHLERSRRHQAAAAQFGAHGDHALAVGGRGEGAAATLRRRRDVAHRRTERLE